MKVDDGCDLTDHLWRRSEALGRRGPLSCSGIIVGGLMCVEAFDRCLSAIPVSATSWDELALELISRDGSLVKRRPAISV